MREILFLARNRLEFTQAAFTALKENTEWERVDRLVAYDDGSKDGTSHWLSEEIVAMNRSGDYPPAIMHHTKKAGPVAIMREHAATTSAETFAKVDNDSCMPKGWLSIMADVLERSPHVDLLGVEVGMAMAPTYQWWNGEYRAEMCRNIGGIGLMRTSVFRKLPTMSADGRFGFTEWQHTHLPSRAWLAPALPVVLLDRLPFEPWISLSRSYVQQNWQRPWPTWEPRGMEWAYQWFTQGNEEVPDEKAPAGRRNHQRLPR